MEKRTIYFNRQKALLSILAGIGIFIGIILFVPGIFKFLLFFVGGSFIYYGSKSISGKPQIIISDEGLYIGFKFNKTIFWNKIEKITIKEKSVDLRLLKFLEIVVRINSNGPSNIMVRDFPLGNLDTPPAEIEKLIKEKLAEKKSITI